MHTFVTEPRTITVGEYTATFNVKFRKWIWNGQETYSISVWETAKALKVIAKAAGLTVLGAKSKSYAGWDSCNLYLKTEITEEQQAKNRELFNIFDPEYTKEPRWEIARNICDAFKGGDFDGMTDSYNYRRGVITVKDPAGNDLELTAKYIFETFETEENHAKWHK